MALIRPGIILPFRHPSVAHKNVFGRKISCSECAGPAAHAVRCSHDANQPHRIHCRAAEQPAQPDHGELLRAPTTRAPSPTRSRLSLTSKSNLTVRRSRRHSGGQHRLRQASRVILAGHLDTVPVIDNFPPKAAGALAIRWLIREKSPTLIPKTARAAAVPPI